MVIAEKTTTAEVYAETPQEQADHQHRKAIQHLKYNKVIMKPGRT